MRQVLTNDLEKAIESINDRKLKKLVVDVTNNGGGSDWVDTVARVISPEPLDCQKVARIKTEDLRKDYVEMKAEILAQLKSNTKKSAKLILESSVSNIDAVLKDFTLQCDRNNYWKKHGFKPKCDVLTKRKLFACGCVPYAQPSALGDIKIRQPIFKSSDFQYREGLFKGEVVVLINRNTSSSAEEFVSLVRDNIPSTKVIGEHRVTLPDAAT